MFYICTLFNGGQVLTNSLYCLFQSFSMIDSYKEIIFYFLEKLEKVMNVRKKLLHLQPLLR